MRFHVADPHPDVKLAEIESPALRARTWLARVCAKLPEDESVQIVGAVTMLQGLEYHHANFMRHVDALRPYYDRTTFGHPTDIGAPLAPKVSALIPSAVERECLDALDHEAVAYLNRLGQFFYFAKARGVTRHLPTLSKLMIFRRKHTAHRSIDAPQGESLIEQQYQAMSFGFYRLMRGGFPSYQIPTGKAHREFQMHRDHPIIMQETYGAMHALHPLPDDA